jgi:CxxC motif-containing protein (DUF1111 family)
MGHQPLTFLLLAGLLGALPDAARADQAPEPVALREAYTQPLPGLSEQEREQFFRGRSVFRQSWVVAPANDRAAGLGPLYNRLSCISCHQKNGRGRSPDGPDERMLSMLVRLSVPGRDEHGGPKPHPAYGGQLNDEGIPGVPAEGRAAIRWRNLAPQTLAGGEKVVLRRPLVSFENLAYGKQGKMQYSLRVGQPVYGLGLLEAVPEATILAIAAESKPDGVKGSANRVWDAAAQHTTLGRFGFKANMPNLRQQSAGAMQGDLGMTSSLFPEENCMPAQKACRAAPSGGHPELSDADLDAVEFYLANLAPPPRRKADDAQVRRGEQFFADAGCAACHRPTLQTGPSERFPLTANRQIAPYTDLLVHDMGKGLADNRPDYQANGRQWRTPPLWGIGLVPLINEHSQFLHDGRARNLQEAVLWHDGEARRSRLRYAAAPPATRRALLAFLESL